MVLRIHGEVGPARGASPDGCGSSLLDRVALTARGLQLAPQVVDGLSLVGNELFDALTHTVLDTRDLPPDLLHIRVLRAVALALPPQARVLVAQVGDRPPDLAIPAR